MKWVKRLFCKHEYKITEEFVLENTNVIVVTGLCCGKCGKQKLDLTPRKII